MKKNIIKIIKIKKRIVKKKMKINLNFQIWAKIL